MQLRTSYVYSRGTIIKKFFPWTLVCLHASDAKYMSSAVFWVITQRMVVIRNRRLQSENDMLARNVCKEFLYALRNNPEGRNCPLPV
jgi:hypothetical protein